MTAAGVSCASCGTELPAASRFCNKCGARITSAPAPAEFKQVTVLFADVVHSMDIASIVGAERLREIMTVLVDRLSAVVARYGGTVDKFTGDGIMAVFGAPLALEDHALRACLTALDLQAETGRLAEEVRQSDRIELHLRVGLNSGRVIAGDIGSTSLGYTTIGKQVGMAQRMESVAPPDGVMLSETTAHLVEGKAVLADRELVRVKHAAEPVPGYRLLGITGQHRVMRRAESALIGRRWEMSAVTALLDRARDGYGAVVSVVGPAGIGKSRLMREVIAIADQLGVQVFSAFCESHTSQVPFHVIIHLMRSATGVEGLAPEQARARIRTQGFDADPDDMLLFEDLLSIRDPAVELPRIDPDARRRRLTAMVNGASLASDTPAVYIVEDAHWIDEASETMLAEFLTVIPKTPLLTLITYRPEYRGTLTQVAGAQTLALAPLSNSEAAALVSQLLGSDPSVAQLAEIIAERAAGTPFFVEEIVRELAERGVLQGNLGAFVTTAAATEVNVPATLQATIAARIDRLDPIAKRTLNAAAVVGSRFGSDVLRQLGIEPDVETLVAAQLIDQVGFTGRPEYVFHHPLIRAVAYETQLKSDRAELHRRVAAAIEHRAASADENAAVIAEHFEAAGDLPAAFGWHMRAAVWANNRDSAAARLSWHRARQVADALPDDHRDRMAMRIAPRTMLCATDWRVHAEDADVRFEELRELCVLTGDNTSLAFGIMGPMSLHAYRGEVREARRMATELMAVLESIGDPALTAQAGYGAIGIKAQAGEMSDVLCWAQGTIDWADGDPTKGGKLIVASPLAGALSLRGFVRSWFGRPGWREDLENSLTFATQSADPLTLAMSVSWAYGMGTWNGVLRPDDTAVRTTESGLNTAEVSGDDYAVTIFKWLLGSILLLRGDPGDQHRGLELLIPLRDMWIQQRYQLSELPVMEMHIAWEQTRAGDLDGGIPAIRKSFEDIRSRGQITYLIPATGVLVETLLARGARADVAEAEAAVAMLAEAPAHESAIRDIWLLRMSALLAKARGDGVAYRDYTDRYRDMAKTLGFEGHIAWAEAMG